MTYLISDIHGMYHTLMRLLSQVRQLDDHPLFVFVGDYVDGGLYSFEVIRELMKLQGEGHIVLKGNHEESLDLFINYTSAGDIPITKKELTSSMYRWGFDKTLRSYGVLEDSLDELKEAMPNEHALFIRSLPVFWSNATHFACHAFMDPTQPPDFSQTREHIGNCLQTRFDMDQANHSAIWNRIGVFGHISGRRYGLQYPYKIFNIRIIDDGGIHGENLIAYCCETDDFIYNPIRKDDLEYS